MARSGSACTPARWPLRALGGGLLLAVALAGPAAGQLLQLTPQQVLLATNYCSGDVRGRIADLDGNGFPDVIMVGVGTCTETRVMMNPGQIGLTASPLVAGVAGGNTNGFVSDINQDGYPDYLHFENNAVTAYLNVGPGALVVSGVTPIATTSASFMSGFLVADLNGDGIDEIVAQYTAITAPGSIPLGFRVWTNTLNGLGTGWSPGPMTTFATTLAGAPLAFTGIVALADVNADGFLDVLAQAYTTIAGVHPGYAASFMGGGNLTFAPAQFASLPTSILAVGDVDHDGFPDIVTGAYHVCFGAATQPFATTVAVPSAGGFLDFAPVDIVDLDGDGLPDLVEHVEYGNQYYSPVCGTRLNVFRNLGNRQFSAPWAVVDVPSPMCQVSNHTWYVGSRPVFADFDNDGDIDILMVPAGGLVPLRYIRNDSHFGIGAAGTGGLTPALFLGAPTIGNSAFAITIGNASPNSLAVLGLSVLRNPAAAANGILLDLSPQSVILPNGTFGFVTTDAVGFASVALPIPNHPALINLTAYAQWGVVDPLGTYNTAFGNFALTQGHTFVVR